MPTISSQPSSARAADDPILRNALRYTISAREYATLHKYILSRSRVVRKHAPSVEKVNRIMNGPGSASRRGSAEEGAETATGKEAPAMTDKRAQQEASKAMVGADDFNTRAIRHSVRVFVGTAVGMKVWTTAMAKIMGKGKEYVRLSCLDFTGCRDRRRIAIALDFSSGKH